MPEKSVSFSSFVRDYLAEGVWDNPAHAVKNLVTCGLTEKAAVAYVKECFSFMRFMSEEW